MRENIKFHNTIGPQINSLVIRNQILKNATFDKNIDTVANSFINDLANALKPVYLPGEKMHIFPVKEGKEQKQAVGYLDDGTMIIIEDGRKHIGKRIEVTVSSILQTSSGRMLFTHPVGKHGKEQNNNGKY